MNLVRAFPPSVAHSRVSLHTELFFEEGGLHSLRPAWTSPVPVAVESNMPKEKWFTPYPLQAKSSISSSKWSNYHREFPLMKDERWMQWINELKPTFKQKWIDNGIYELIMLSKTIAIIKPELLTTALLFWNSSTITFDFKMGPMFLTILDMAQVFGLRPLDRIIDFTHDWAPPSRLTAESSGSSASFLQLEYDSVTFKSYGTSFMGFIPFANKDFGPLSSNANNDQEHIYFML
ncbi:hypothetical protein FF1_024870 [Malus domestica]